MSRVVIPIETKVREFHGKLWLALNLVDHDHEVILGPEDEVKHTLYKTQPDIYLAKDPGDNTIEFFKSLRKAGCLVCGLDTEGAVFTSLKDFARNKKESPKYLDRYFMWGQTQTEYLKDKFGCNKTIITTGNPRFDLLSGPFGPLYAKKAKNLQQEYGDYILFNTNFSWANHFNPKDQKIQQMKLFNEYDLDKYQYNSKLFAEFITAIHHLKPHQLDCSIVIRPHPSENHTSYEQYFCNYDNVFVEHSGDVRNWIRGAKVVVHNSCTTGIEAAMMERPVLTYRPIQNNKYDSELPNIVSEEVRTPSELADRISQYIKQEPDYQMSSVQKQRLEQYFNNLISPAGEEIAEQIDSLEIPHKQTYTHLKPTLKKQLEWMIKSSLISVPAIKLYDFINEAFRNYDTEKQREYRKQKFSCLTEEEIHSTLQELDTEIETKDIIVLPVSGTQNTFLLRRR